MHKIIAAVLCLLLLAGLCACTPAAITEPTVPDVTTPSLRENGTFEINNRGETETDSNGEPVINDETDANGEPVSNGATDANGEPVSNGAAESGGENGGEEGSEPASLPQTAYVLSVSESLAEEGSRRQPTGIVEYCELKPQEELSLPFSLGVPLEFAITEVSQNSVTITLLGEAELDVSGKLGENNDPKQFTLKPGESVEVELKDLTTTGFYSFTIEKNPQGG